VHGLLLDSLVPCPGDGWLCGGAPPWLERVPVCGLFCEGWWRPGSFACVRHRCASVAWCRGPKQAAGWQPPRAVANG
jgi:hypothetical protein